MKTIIKIGLALLFLINTIAMSAQTIEYTFPEETELHEGTWLQWPHNNLYGPWYVDDVEATWVAMTNELQAHENVHIIVYNNTELTRVTNVLTNANIPMVNIDFYVIPTDDVWSRDNGPMFVFDENDELTMLDWGFNGWGNDTPYTQCDVVPAAMSNLLNIPLVDLNAMVLEGGAIEHDGNGTVMATRSSVTHSSRNPNLTEAEIENYLTTYAGLTNFIWLDGLYGDDITDMHIDGFVKFAGGLDVFTMNSADLDYWGLSAADKATLYGATNKDGQPYNFFYLPLTQNNVTTTYGNTLTYKGSYANFYIANNLVLVPTYNDPNDAVALSIIQDVYTDRTVVGIDVRNLYEYGGMIHCITQQQPAALMTNLPVELSYFRAKEVNCAIEIKWASTTEINNETFILERSEDGISFEKIAELAGQGTTTKEHIYKYIDSNNKGNNFYRLRQIDRDGTEEISSIIFVENTCQNALNLQLVPNITSDISHLQLTGDLKSDVFIQVLNANGQVVQAFEIQHHSEFTEQVIVVNTLPEGIYYLRAHIAKNHAVLTQKLVVTQ